MQNGCCCKHLWCKTCWDDYVIILCRLVTGDQNRVGLAQVNVKRLIGVLQCMCPFNLDQQHLVTLNSEIDRCREPDIWYAKSVSLAWPTILDRERLWSSTCINVEVNCNCFCYILPWSTVNVLPFDPRPFMRSPSGKGRLSPLSRIAFKSCIMCDLAYMVICPFCN